MPVPANIDGAVLERVCKCFADALGLDAEEVNYDSKVIGDLGAESLDFLDIAFRLEREFDIRIPRGGVEAASKAAAEAAGEVHEVGGVLTEIGLQRLSEIMPEVPKEEFVPGLKSVMVPTLFRVGTFYNIVVGLQEAKKNGTFVG